MITRPRSTSHRRLGAATSGLFSLLAVMVAAGLTLAPGSSAEGARRKRAAVSKKAKGSKARLTQSKGKARGGRKNADSRPTTKVMTFAADDLSQPAGPAGSPTQPAPTSTTTTELALSSGAAQVRKQGHQFLISGSVSRDELRLLQKRLGSRASLSIEGEVIMEGEAAALVDAGKVDRLVREIEALR